MPSGCRAARRLGASASAAGAAEEDDVGDDFDNLPQAPAVSPSSSLGLVLAAEDESDEEDGSEDEEMGEEPGGEKKKKPKGKKASKKKPKKPTKKKGKKAAAGLGALNSPLVFAAAVGGASVLARGLTHPGG